MNGVDEVGGGDEEGTVALGVDGGYDEGLAVEMELELLHDPGHKLQILHLASFPLNRSRRRRSRTVRTRDLRSRHRASASEGGDLGREGEMLREKEQERRAGSRASRGELAGVTRRGGRRDEGAGV